MSDSDERDIERLKSRIDAAKDMRRDAMEQGDDAMVEFLTGRISGLCSGISIVRQRQQSDTDNSQESNEVGSNE